MYMRGVFFVVFAILLSCAASAQAVQVGGELETTLSSTEAGVSLSIDIESQLSRCLIRGGLQAEAKMVPAWQGRVEPWWELSLPVSEHVLVIAGQNREHFTSSDVFRLINKNNYTAETTAALLYTEQVKAGLLRNVPLRGRDLVDAVFVESVLDIGKVSLSSLQMRYAGSAEGGTAQLVQAQAELGFAELTAAHGWQSDARGAESQGTVLELKSSSPRFSGSLALQSIDSGFQSLLAKANRYTPNRKGWQLELAKQIGQVELGLNLRRHRSIDGSREYNQLTWKVKSRDRGTGLEWRLQPTPAFVMRVELDDRLFQFDPLNGTLRADFQLGKSMWSVRFDAVRLIGRLEYRLNGTFEWRLIAKQDFLHHRFHYSFLVRQSGERSRLQLEIGEYDRGNLGSGFNNPPSFCISWGWKF